jgi:putative Mn2+ efflux pump MntP
VVALLLVAVSVGLDNFGASAAMGVSGVSRKLRIRVSVIFGIFEAAMPVAGLAIGHSLSGDLGAAAKPIGGTVLGVAGAYVITSELMKVEKAAKRPEPSLRRLILIGAALSIDNLVIGFALGAYRVNLVIAAVTIGAVSVALSLVGLEIGGRVGDRLGQRSELVGGAALILVGVAMGTGLL